MDTGQALALPATPPASPVDADAKVAGTVTVILALGVLTQVVLYLAGRSDSFETATVIRTGTWVILGLYAVVLALVVRRAGGIDCHPVWSRGPAAEGAVAGFLLGVALATGLLMAVRSAAGEFRVDDSLRLLVGDATPSGILLAVAVGMVAAPVVEELLFRGLVAEALRYRGRRTAVGVSAVLFSAWHLSPDALAYYGLAGVLLGLVYWKWGLVSSTACHLAFNGTLVLVTVLLVVGPGTAIVAQGVEVEVPGGWVAAAPTGLPTAVLAATGPSGAVLVVERSPTPGPVAPAEMARLLESGEVFVPGFEVRPGSVRLARYRAGTAVRLEVVADGREGWGALFPRADALWTLTLTTAGSARAKADFEDMLATLRLP